MQLCTGDVSAVQLCIHKLTARTVLMELWMQPRDATPRQAELLEKGEKLTHCAFISTEIEIVKLRQGSGKDRQGMALRKAKGLKA